MRFCVFALVQVVCAEEVRPLVALTRILDEVCPVLKAGSLRVDADYDAACN